jgi:predicted secreted protein
MNFFSGLVVYVVLWWVIFFIALPIGVSPPHEVGESAGPGHDAGAPVKPRLWIKAAATTVIAGLLWAVAWWLITSGNLSIRG